MLKLPEDGVALQRLRRLSVSAQDCVETLAARPDPNHHPVLWGHLERCHHALTSEMGIGLPASGYKGFPALSLESGPVGMHLYVWLYLSVLPDVRRFHVSRDIADETSWVTLSDLGRGMQEHRAIHGTSGIGRFGQWCPPLRFRGTEYSLGRLAYDRGRGELPNGDTGQLLTIHIPSGDPLTTDSCESSFRQALDFFERHFPDEPVAAFVCHSWLLDPQLGEYLPADSNIMRFQRRFELGPLNPSAVHDFCDTDVLEYVFGKAIDESKRADDLLDSLPQDTTMRRAFTTHLRSGRHWHARTGWISFGRVVGSTG